MRQECTKLNEAEMICMVPPIDLPDELREVNSTFIDDIDDIVITSARRSRRRREADHGDRGWQLLDRLWNWVRTVSWPWSWASRRPRRLGRQKRAPVSYVSNENVSMSLYLGFIMDRYTSLRNISKTKPDLRLELIPFHFDCDHTPVSFDPAVNPLIKIKVVYYFCRLFLFFGVRFTRIIVGNKKVV